MKLYEDLADDYFLIENHHRDIDDDISFIRSCVNPMTEPSLLDLGCGSGEHINQLSKYGIQCTGIDQSEEMIEVAKKRFPHRVTFKCMDLRNIDYYSEFDIITSLFGSFDYLIENADIERALWNVWRSLKPGGLGIFEIWNSYPIDQINNKELGLVSTTMSGKKKIERFRGFLKVEKESPGTVVDVFYKYVITEADETKELEDQHRMRSFDPDEFAAFLTGNGLSVTEIFANTLREPYSVRSNRILVVFKKTEE